MKRLTALTIFLKSHVKSDKNKWKGIRERKNRRRGKRNGSNRDREGRSADNVATTGWLIPFYHTKHCALDADKNTQSNKQKEKKERVKTLHNSI